jgi:hypothetical protein
VRVGIDELRVVDADEPLGGEQRPAVDIPFIRHAEAILGAARRLGLDP